MFIEPEHSLIDLAATDHGMLSPIFGGHLQNRPPFDLPPLYQADHHPHVLEDHRVGLDGSRLARGSSAPGSLPPAGCLLVTSALIEIGLLFLAPGLPVISGSALCGGLLAVSLPATEGTPQIAPSGITGVSKKENATVPAPGQAGAQVRLGS